MNEKKSNIPDLGEISSMAGKLFKDVKTSVCEIIGEYKSKRATNDADSSSNDGDVSTGTTKSGSSAEDKKNRY